MNKDFKSYVKNNPGLKDGQENKNDKKDKINQGNVNQEQIAETVQNIANKYEGKSQQELMNEILQQTKKGKQDGSVNVSELENMAQKVAPMLNLEQQKKLVEIMELIKKS